MCEFRHTLEAGVVPPVFRLFIDLADPICHYRRPRLPGRRDLPLILFPPTIGSAAVTNRPQGNSSSTPLVNSPCLQGEQVSFTGVLASMTHQQAMDLVARNGGTSSAHINRQTTMLVIGEEGWPLESNGQPSVKLQDASELAKHGQPLNIISESEWLHLLNLDQRRSEIQRAYTPAMLSQLLDVPVHVIRRWERKGLIRPVRRVYRLPYFSFQEVAGARRLSELLAQGVPRSEIESSLGRIMALCPSNRRSLDQLELLARDARIVFRDDRGFLEPVSGQRLFTFDDDPDENTGTTEEEPRESLQLSEWALDKPDQRWTFRDWFDRGRQLLEDGDAGEAVEAFRMCLMERPGEAEIHFHLAEALYRCDRSQAALERYYVAVEFDHEFIEAWTQLGCLHAELDELEPALEAFSIALDAHPDFPDAHWHKAEVLFQLDQTARAIPHWERYLEFDIRGPWAETARQRLDKARATVPEHPEILPIPAVRAAGRNRPGRT